jgi:hypothetical protein
MLFLSCCVVIAVFACVFLEILSVSSAILSKSTGSSSFSVSAFYKMA